MSRVRYWTVYQEFTAMFEAKVEGALAVESHAAPAHASLDAIYA